MTFQIQATTTNVQSSIQTVDWGLHVAKVPGAWRKTKGKGVKVAVLDTGIDRNHPDLVASLRGGINYTNGSLSDYQDKQGHGTHCAGIIAGSDNGQGVVGIAPEAELYALKILGDDGSGGYHSIERGIQWCIDNGMDVISMSLGTHQVPPARLHDVIKRAYAAGIAIVVASGNENGGVCYPAVYPETIAVGAVNARGERASFSNFGKDLDIVAPGVDVYSTYPVNAYAKLSGTSMATPLVAGAIALYISHKREQNLHYTVQDIHQALSVSAKDIGLVGYDPMNGHGMLDVQNLLNL